MISIMILGFIVIVTMPILFQINKLNIKTTNQYEISRVAQNYIEELKSANLIINADKIYSLNELLNRETKFVANQYTVKIRVEKVIGQKNFYRVDLELKDEQNNYRYILSSYINQIKNMYSSTKCYDEFPIKQEDLIN